MSANNLDIPEAAFEDAQQTEPDDLPTPSKYSTYTNDQPNIRKHPILVEIWKYSVHLYDFLGLLEILPLGTIHFMKPYYYNM